MNNVVPIRGRALIETLEQWLEQAKRGEVVAICFAAVMKDDGLCEGWAGNVDKCTMSLYGAVNVLRDQYFHMLIQHYDTSSRIKL